VSSIPWTNTSGGGDGEELIVGAEMCFLQELHSIDMDSFTGILRGICGETALKMQRSKEKPK
jgi:hypothetical protein